MPCHVVQGPDPSAINAELLAKSPDTVHLLLGFLEEEPAGIKDFYVRYHTVQLLTALAANGPYRLQGVSSPGLNLQTIAKHLTLMRTSLHAVNNVI